MQHEGKYLYFISLKYIQKQLYDIEYECFHKSEHYRNDHVI